MCTSPHHIFDSLSGRWLHEKGQVWKDEQRISEASPPASKVHLCSPASHLHVLLSPALPCTLAMLPPCSLEQFFPLSPFSFFSAAFLFSQFFFSQPTGLYGLYLLTYRFLLLGDSSWLAALFLQQLSVLTNCTSFSTSFYYSQCWGGGNDS